MPEPLAAALARLRTDLLDPDRLVRAVGAGHRRGLRDPDPRRVRLRPVDLKVGRRLLVEEWDGTQTTTAHHDYGSESEQVVDRLLAQPYGNWHVDTTEETTQLRVTKKGQAQVHRVATTRAQRTVHDREAGRLLDDEDALLTALGADASKRRQVEAFLRAMQPVVPPAPDGDSPPVTVVDLGCGNAALTLAAYRYLTAGLGRAVRVVGVDVKEQARRHNESLVASLGWGDRVSFVESTILDADVDLGPSGTVPDLVVALHACDTATDEALARAVRWGSRVILAAPCCHHDLQRQLAQAAVPVPYGLLARDGVLRERFADVLTDALRAELLRMLGYRVEVLDFIASRHTPRNTMIRAIRTTAAPAPDRREAYLALTGAWGVRPRLETLLADLLVPVLGPR